MSIPKAEQFLLSSLDGGLAKSFDTISRKWAKPYPEVTGYLLSYFSENYNVLPKEILNAADFLIDIQHPIGGFSCFSDKHFLFTFDTAQIMHGLASLYKRTLDKKYLLAAEKCANFVLNMQISSGAMFPVFDLNFQAKFVDKSRDWGLRFSSIQVKNIEGLLILYEITNNMMYKEAIQKLVMYGKNACDLAFTHPGAYCLEGLLAAGEKEFVSKKLCQEIIPRLQSNGFLPYGKDLNYAYVSGSVQMGILLFKTGFLKEAKQILEWSRVVQGNHESGGLFQYANFDGTINKDVHGEINTWGTKYYAQLEKLF